MIDFEKREFSREELDNAFGYAFADNDEVTKILIRLFKENPPAKLRAMKPSYFRKFISNIERSDEVRKVHEYFKEQASTGEQFIESVAYTMFSYSQSLGIAPNKKIYHKDYYDVWAFCSSDDKRIARALIEQHRIKSDDELENLVLRPENLFYSNVSDIFAGSKLSCKHGAEDISLKKSGFVHVYSDEAEDIELERRVKGVIRTLNTKYNATKPRINQRISFNRMQEYLIGSFQKNFKSVRHGGQIEYTKVYKILEWVLRENIKVEDFKEIDPSMRTLLKESIEEVLHYPYVIIRGRIKGAVRSEEKSIQSLYNIRNPDELGTVKKYRDANGLRVLVGQVRDVYALGHYLRDSNLPTPWEIIEVKDYIRSPKNNEYKAYHMILKYRGRFYELQVRTHQMDRNIELEEAQSHDGFLERKRKLLKQVPERGRIFSSTVFGVKYKPAGN